MKHIFKTLVLLAGLLTSASAFTFTHPGLLSSTEELEFVKAKIAQGAQPWTSDLNMMMRNTSLVNRTPHVTASMNATTGESAARDDAQGAYYQALLWYYTGDTTYANKSIAIMNAWATTFTGFQSTDLQRQLLTGWIGSIFPLAAEIMRSYPQWSSTDIAQFSSMLNSAFLPTLTPGNATYNGNWELTMINAMMAIAIFNEDTTTMNKAISMWRTRVPEYFYMTSDGAKPILPAGTSLSYWFNGVLVDGLCQETCRDNGHHMQFGFASAINVAEMAHHQGIDLYTENQARLTTTMELHARMLAENTMLHVCANDTPTVDHYDTWEIAYNQYHNRMGQNLPWTDSLIRVMIRPYGTRYSWNILLETFTHADVDSNASTAIRNFQASDRDQFAMIRNNAVELQAPHAGIFAVTTNKLNGQFVSQIQISAHAGQSVHIPLPLAQMATGMYVIHISTETGNTTLLYMRQKQ